MLKPPLYYETVDEILTEIQERHARLPLDFRAVARRLADEHSDELLQDWRAAGSKEKRRILEDILTETYGEEVARRYFRGI